MIARPLPLILFGPLAVWWMILHWRAVRRAESGRLIESLRANAAAAARAREAVIAMAVAMIQAGQVSVSEFRMRQGLTVALDLSPLDLYRPTSQTLRDAGIPSTFDRTVVDVTTDRL